MEGPNVLRLWNPGMVAVIANSNGFRTAALDTHWTTTQIRGDNFLIRLSPQIGSLCLSECGSQWGSRPFLKS